MITRENIHEYLGDRVSAKELGLTHDVWETALDAAWDAYDPDAGFDPKTDEVIDQEAADENWAAVQDAFQQAVDDLHDPDYSKMSQQEFNEILEELVGDMSASEILSIGEVRNELAEELNNEVLDIWVQNNPGKAYPGRKGMTRTKCIVIEDGLGPGIELTLEGPLDSGGYWESFDGVRGLMLAASLDLDLYNILSVDESALVAKRSE